MGNLKSQSWDEVYNGDRAVQIRQMVAACAQNCWMVGSAPTAMRHPVFTKLPKPKPMAWVIVNKLRATLGLRIPFEKYVNFYQSGMYPSGIKRQNFLNVSSSVRRQLHTEDDGHYDAFGEFRNR